MTEQETLHKNTSNIPNSNYLTLKAEWSPRAMRFNILKKLYVPSTECIDVPHSVLKTNSSHFPPDNSPVFITERILVYRAVRTDSLNIIQVNLILYMVKWIFVLQERRIQVQFLKCSFTYIRHVHRTIILTSLGNVWRNFPRRQLRNSSLSDRGGVLHGRLPTCNTQEPHKLPIIKGMYNNCTRNRIYWSWNRKEKDFLAF